MSRRLKLVAISLLLLSTLWIALRFGFPYTLFFQHTCDRFETELSYDGHGRKVISTLEACTTFGSTAQEWVDLVAASGRRERIFTFVPWGGELPLHEVTVRGPLEPVVTWSGPSAMHIAVGTVDQILDQRDHVDGVHVSYEVGTVIYK